LINKNKIRTFLIAKSFAKVFLILSVFLIIFPLLIFLYIKLVVWRFPRALIISPGEAKKYLYFMNTIIPAMVISGIIGLVSSSITLSILTKYHKLYQLNFEEEESRFNEMIFRLY